MNKYLKDEQTKCITIKTTKQIYNYQNNEK